jgi:hypothetical protein
VAERDGSLAIRMSEERCDLSSNLCSPKVFCSV